MTMASWNALFAPCAGAESMADTSKNTQVSALAARLRGLRGLMTQQELGMKLCVSAATISNWENGLAVPSRARLMQYASVFQPERTDVLLEQLVVLGQQAGPLIQDDEPTMLELLQSIQWLLTEIRDLMPPKSQ